MLHAKKLSDGDNKHIYLKRQPGAGSRLVVRNSMACRGCAPPTSRHPRQKELPTAVTLQLPRKLLEDPPTR